MGLELLRMCGSKDVSKLNKKKVWDIVYLIKKTNKNIFSLCSIYYILYVIYLQIYLKLGTNPTSHVDLSVLFLLFYHASTLVFKINFILLFKKIERFVGIWALE